MAENFESLPPNNDSNVEHVIAQAQSDLSSTTCPFSSTVVVGPSPVHPEGDVTLSSDLSNRTQQLEYRYDGSADFVGDQAHPFHPGYNFPDQPVRNGARPELPLSEDRLLLDMHFNKVCSRATRSLNDGLMIAANFTPMQREDITRSVDRQHACFEILSKWKNSDNRQKTVRDMKELLQTVQGGTTGMYNDLIDYIVNSPP